MSGAVLHTLLMRVSSALVSIIERVISDSEKMMDFDIFDVFFFSVLIMAVYFYMNGPNYWWSKLEILF